MRETYYAIPPTKGVSPIRKISVKDGAEAFTVIPVDLDREMAVDAVDIDCDEGWADVYDWEAFNSRMDKIPTKRITGRFELREIVIPGEPS